MNQKRGCAQPRSQAYRSNGHEREPIPRIPRLHLAVELILREKIIALAVHLTRARERVVAETVRPRRATGHAPTRPWYPCPRLTAGNNKELWLRCSPLFGERLEELLALTDAEALNATSSGDAQLVHDLGGLGLAIAGERLDEGGDLHAGSDGIIGVQDGLEGNLALLDLLTKLGTGVTGRSGLLESGLALLVSELGEAPLEPPRVRF